MNIVKNIFIGVSLILGASFANHTLAHGDNKPKHGGIVQEVSEVQYELVAKPTMIAIYIEDHGKSDFS
jgi:hypothetical protein